MQQYNRLTHYCVISVFNVIQFIVIAASQSVNKNVTTGPKQALL